MHLGDQHSSARLESDRLYKDRGGEYAGGIQRPRGPRPPIEKPVVLNELLKSLGVNDDSESDSRTAT